jgi:hypothetical protein
MPEDYSFYFLNDIASWAEKGEVDLPKVQRDFVWKPHQIEDLWDSLLRNYPIGAFVFNIDKEGKRQLLDGQQRATAITLGFNKQTHRHDEDKYKLFIDLEIPQHDAREYYFRVITDSHPWGYQRKLNNKPLESQQKREAVNYWDDVDLINPDLKQCFPFDSTLPIPLAFFIEASNVDVLKNSIYSWSLWENVNKKLDDYIKKYPNQFDKKEELKSLINNEEFRNKRIEQLYDKIQQMLNQRRISAVNLNNALEEMLNKNQDTEQELQVNSDSNIEQNHDVENLFVRLNAGGTPLRGEDLNYSILKSKISLETQQLINNNCDYFINPARFITVAFRLQPYAVEKIKLREGLNMNIKPRQFQARLNNKKDIEAFGQFVIRLLTEKVYDGKTLFEYTKHLLEYQPENKTNTNPNANPNGFPHLLVNKLVNQSPELLFMFWYRVVVIGDRFIINSKSNKIHEKMLGMYSLFLWLGKGESKRDYTKLLRNIWPAMKVLDCENFWSSVTVKRAMLDDVLPQIPSFSKSTKQSQSISWLQNQPLNLKSSLFDKLYKTSDAAFNTDVLFYNTDLVLYAQRDFLFYIFKNKQFHLDDTNVPFDWDHIYPSKLVENKKNLPRLVHEFYNSIGNFRAWPYELNRMDNANSPRIKFNPFLDNEQSNNFQSWQGFITKYPKLIGNVKELTKKLLDWSECNSNWASGDVKDMKTGEAKQVIELIIERGVEIIGKWYEKLHIEELIPDSKPEMESIINKAFKVKKTENNPDWITSSIHEDIWTLEEVSNLILKEELRIQEASLVIYLTYSTDLDQQMTERDILFGFYDFNQSDFFEKLKVADENNYEINRKQNYLQGYFTLVSQQEQSLNQLLVDIAAWINHKDFPLKKYRTDINNILAEGLLKKYNSIFL